MMMLNSEVVAHMYDKDYSGNNQRFAMFGQSIIVEMRVGSMKNNNDDNCIVSGRRQVQGCSRQRVSWCSRWKESIYKLSRSSCRKEFALIIYETMISFIITITTYVHVFYILYVHLHT